MENIKTYEEAKAALDAWAGCPHLRAGFAALSPEVLTAIAFGGVDAIFVARAEMAKRGLNQTGHFIGFSEADAVWESANGCVQEAKDE